MIGQKFDCWTVVAEAPKPSPRCKPYWSCVCECGTARVFPQHRLGHPDNKSCGCLLRRKSRERALALNLRHGESRDGKSTTEYEIWKALFARCYNKNHRYFYNYGGRGIVVCDRWRSYENFLADMGRRPSKLYSIDRIDNDGPYAPDNCRWATRREQNLNGRLAHWIEFRGQRKPITDWEKELGVPRSTLRNRLARGEQLDGSRVESVPSEFAT